jgi:membrane protein DedA with SNARE-associated domain
MAEFGYVLGVLEPWIHQYGVVAVGVILGFESFGAPLPGESLLILAAVMAGRGEMSFFGLLISAWTGAVVGDNVGYLIGRLLGRNLLLRYGGKIGLTVERLGKVEAAFARYGPVTVSIARFVVVLRQLNGIVAGTAKMDWRRFLVFNAFGGALWVLVWVLVGYYLGLIGAYSAALIHKLGYMGAAFVLIALVVTLSWIYVRRVYARRRSAERGEEEWRV